MQNDVKQIYLCKLVSDDLSVCGKHGKDVYLGDVSNLCKFFITGFCQESLSYHVRDSTATVWAFSSKMR